MVGDSTPLIGKRCGWKQTHGYRFLKENMETHRKKVGRSPQWDAGIHSLYPHLFFLKLETPLPARNPQSKTSKDHRSLEGDACSIFKKWSNQVHRPRTNCLLGVACFFPLENLSHGPPFQNPPGFNVKPPELLGYCLVDASTACTVPANDVTCRG